MKINHNRIERRIHQIENNERKDWKKNEIVGYLVFFCEEMNGYRDKVDDQGQLRLQEGRTL